MADRIHYRTCNLCEAMCGLEIEISGDAVTRIRGDMQDEFSRGYHCIKGEALADLHIDRNRLKRPLRRKGKDWEEITWHDAFDDAAENILRLQKKYGRDSVASYIGNPNVHHYGSLLGLSGFLGQLRSKNRFSATSVDQLPHHMVGTFMFGHQMLLPIPDIDRTDFMLILGANPLVSRGSMMTAPDVTTRLKAIRERGGKVVLIDPRRTETAAIADSHHFIRPGTDAALLLAMLHVIFAEGLAQPGRLASFTDGIDFVQTAVADTTPEAAARITGIDAAVIRALAQEFAAARTAVCYGRLGVSAQEFGALTQWLLTVLNIVTGNLDRAGGAMFTTPAMDILPHLSRGRFGRWQSRVRGLPEFAGELPTSVLAEEMDTPGPGQIKGLVTVAGNPVLSTPNGARLERALPGLEYMVSIDLYVNETTRFANLILPPTGALEHENYDIAFHSLAVRNTAKFSAPCFVPAAGSKHDWEILDALERRLGRKSLVKRLMTPERTLALGLRFGPHGAGANPFGKGISLSKLKKLPHGLDLGPLQPRLPARLFTENKRINAAPALFRNDLNRAKDVLFGTPSPDSPYDLRLIGRRQVRTNNSWMGHIDRLTRGKPACTALIHTQDAAARDIKTGDQIRVESRVGALVITATVVDHIMPGVVSIPHGYGHSRDGVRLDISQNAVGVSVNDITDGSVVDLLSGNAVFNGVPVRVERAH